MARVPLPSTSAVSSPVRPPRSLTQVGPSQGLRRHPDYPEVVPSKAERRAARNAVATYQEAQLAVLVAHVGEAVDRFRADESDAFGVDEVLYQYARAAKELWKFCNYVPPEITARVLAEDPPTTGGNAERLTNGDGWMLLSAVTTP